MGQAKALLPHPAGLTLAEVVGRRVAAVADLAIEVGGGWSRLPWCRDHEPGAGPLQAVLTGWRTLTGDLGRDPAAPLLVVAGDLPLVSAELLGALAGFDHAGSVVLTLGDRAQPLLARWSGAALGEAARRFAEGERRVGWLADLDDTKLVPEHDWVPLAGPLGALVASDVDDPDDWSRLVARIEHSTAGAEP